MRRSLVWRGASSWLSIGSITAASSVTEEYVAGSVAAAYTSAKRLSSHVCRSAS